VDQGGWEEVFGPVEEETEADGGEAGLVRLEDASHRAEPPWPERRTLYDVSVTCTYRTRRGRWSAPQGSNQILVTEGGWFRYRASTSVPKPYEVRWQVVNTGAHARQRGQLRGRDFLPAKKRNGTPSPDPLEHWEYSEFSGKHWIECFIVKEGLIWARSGPFVVGIVNRKRTGHPFWRGMPRRRRRR